VESREGEEAELFRMSMKNSAGNGLGGNLCFSLNNSILSKVVERAGLS